MQNAENLIEKFIHVIVIAVYVPGELKLQRNLRNSRNGSVFIHKLNSLICQNGICGVKFLQVSGQLKA